MVVCTFNPSIWESHAFNPITKEVKIGRDVVEQREGYKVRGDRSIAVSLMSSQSKETA